MDDFEVHPPGTALRLRRMEEAVGDADAKDRKVAAVEAKIGKGSKGKGLSVPAAFARIERINRNLTKQLLAVRAVMDAARNFGRQITVADLQQALNSVEIEDPDAGLDNL